MRHLPFLLTRSGFPSEEKTGLPVLLQPHRKHVTCHVELFFATLNSATYRCSVVRSPCASASSSLKKWGCISPAPARVCPQYKKSSNAYSRKSTQISRPHVSISISVLHFPRIAEPSIRGG